MTKSMYVLELRTGELGNGGVPRSCSDLSLFRGRLFVLIGLTSPTHVFASSDYGANPDGYLYPSLLACFRPRFLVVFSPSICW